MVEKSKEEEVKALVLLSGGLDSILAAKIVNDQDLLLQGVSFKNGFSTGAENRQAQLAGKEIGIEVETVELPDSYLKIIKSPHHGRGSAINPCLDCRIYMLNHARKYMKEHGYDFVVTGEVLGQRPMSQHRQGLELVEKKSGLEGLLLRPLSAKLLAETIPEKEGWVDREQLFEIQGRSRSRQLELAEEYGLEEFDQPAGGCLLTEEEYGHRVEEAFEHKGKDFMAREDFDLLKHGRHFRLPEGSKAIVGRDEDENQQLAELAGKHWKLEVKNHPSPLTLVSPEASHKDLQLAARLTARYSDGRGEEEVLVDCEGGRDRGSELNEEKVSPLSPDDPLIEELRISSS